MTGPIISSNPELPSGAPVPVPPGADPFESVQEVKGFTKNITIAVVRVFYNRYLDEVDEVHQRRYQWTTLVTVNTTLKQFCDWANAWAVGTNGGGTTISGFATTTSAASGVTGIAGAGLAAAFLITRAYAHTQRYAVEDQGAGGWYLISDEPYERTICRETGIGVNSD